MRSYEERDIKDETPIEGYNEDFDEEDKELSEEEMFEDAVKLMYPNADEEELEEELGDRFQKFY